MIDGFETLVGGVLIGAAGVLSSELGIGVPLAAYGGVTISLGAFKIYSSWKNENYYIPDGALESISYDHTGDGTNGQVLDLLLGFPNEIYEVPLFLYDLNIFLNFTDKIQLDINSPFRTSLQKYKCLY